ncbi:MULTISPECIES: RNA polymerase subunit sigma [unclassified Rhodococcus (in: high G+C Gram-positive bacteria)]|uniref:RNA polymerase subunit sigma n=1 Tax=unclassified Rhodococcus (in: high G+C Gram-positive bacteria) TaxID=192944 RepID=UPI0024B7A018|nr:MULTISPECIES: RNA polymerase subunit sigma [unclassified Rhodococcus (in: high G+C Gram-positive bacteria)]MDI9959992.1 RNA polymerase subunit sigma [Rhodococcus sp. IEGM 1237]MDI9965885.1 RNA polymerase subunit sigma [Rhodococcus sp. IEGM 1251]MDV8128136.1 RNA polymerase subunit sigma [Rhodococcus sp. IEGM 1304]
MLQEGALEVLAAAARSGSNEAMANLYAAFRPMVVLRCRAELDRTVSDSAADASCLAVLEAVRDGSELNQPFLRLLYARTSVAIARAASNGFSGGPLPSPTALPVVERDVLVLRLIVGLGTEATATSLARTTDEVSLDLHRALQRLRKLPSANAIREILTPI